MKQPPKRLQRQNGAWEKRADRFFDEHPWLAFGGLFILIGGLALWPAIQRPHSRWAAIVFGSIGTLLALVEHVLGMVRSVPLWVWLIAIPLVAIWRHMAAAERARWEVECEKRHEERMDNDPEYHSAVMDRRWAREQAGNPPYEPDLDEKMWVMPDGEELSTRELHARFPEMNPRA